MPFLGGPEIDPHRSHFFWVYSWGEGGLKTSLSHGLGDLRKFTNILWHLLRLLLKRALKVLERFLSNGESRAVFPASALNVGELYWYSMSNFISKPPQNHWCAMPPAVKSGRVALVWLQSLLQRRLVRCGSSKWSSGLAFNECLA